jgi:hypothetical protein
VNNFKESDPSDDRAVSVRLFFQRSGDNFTADGGRWWSNPIHYRLASGRSVLDGPLTGDQWSGGFGNFGSERPIQFNSSKRSLRAVGFSFGGCFFAHRAYVSAEAARFNTSSFIVR